MSVDGCTKVTLGDAPSESLNLRTPWSGGGFSRLTVLAHTRQRSDVIIPQTTKRCSAVILGSLHGFVSLCCLLLQGRKRFSMGWDEATPNLGVRLAPPSICFTSLYCLLLFLCLFVRRLRKAEEQKRQLARDAAAAKDKSAAAEVYCLP